MIFLLVEILNSQGELGHPESHNVLIYIVARAFKVEAKVPAHHEIQHEKAVVVVLEGVPHVDDEGMLNLLQQAPLLDNVRDCLLLDTSRLVDVLEGVELLQPLVLDDAHLAERALADRAVEIEVVEADLAVEVDRLREAAAHGAHGGWKSNRRWRRRRSNEV